MKSINRVIEEQTHFSEVTSLEANMKKSSIFLAGMDEVVKNQTLEETSFSTGEFLSDI